MYSYISGTLEEIMEDSIVVDNHGIGYQIAVPGRVISRLPERGAEVKIYTYLHVREDCFALYGFLSREELKLFRMVLNVNGIGPKSALSILSTLSPDEIIAAISKDDVKTISKAPGIGKKTAQKLIIELKDKVHLEDILPGSEEENSEAAGIPGESEVAKETVEALVSLGYSAREVREVLRGIEITEDRTVEDVLKEALRNMALL